MQHDALAGAEARFKIRAVKKFAGHRTAGIAHEEMVDGAGAAPAIADQASIGDFSLQGVGAAGLDFAQRREMNAIFVTKREIAEQILDGADAALGQQLGALRAYAFQVHHVGCGRQRHGSRYITFVVEAPAQGTCPCFLGVLILEELGAEKRELRSPLIQQHSTSSTYVLYYI